MSEIRRIEINFEEVKTFKDLPETERLLVEKAIEIAHKSYSPYSLFPVGAALQLENGEIFVGNNQENISYPAGTCAERTVLNYVHANFPDKKISAIAILGLNSFSDSPISPCGICRQVLVELERNQGQNIRVILHKCGGQTYIFKRAADLLPLAFEDNQLKKI